MGFNYNWFKRGAVTLSNQRVFNRYFKESSASEYCETNRFMGLEFTHKIKTYIKTNTELDKYFTQRERYYPVFSMTNNFFRIMVFFMPPILGGTCLLMLGLAIIPALWSAETDYPWLLLAIVLTWNLLWLNFRFILDFIYSKFKGAYIDREKQTISFTWHVSGNPEKNEFGHATFPLSDIEAFASLQLRNQNGGSAYALCLAHKDHDSYDGAFLQISVPDSAHNTNFCQMEWELIQRFADNTLPLPDIPDLEKFRQLDPVTVAYDKKHQRPKFHWRNMHVKQQRAIEAEIEKQVNSFFFSSATADPDRYAQKELEKPWRTWKVDKKYFTDEEAIPLWKRRAKLILCHLTMGF